MEKHRQQIVICFKNILVFTLNVGRALYYLKSCVLGWFALGDGREA